MRPFEKVWMEYVREKLDTFGDSWAGARKVCVRVYSDDPGAPRRNDCACGLNGLIQSQAARRNYDDLRGSSRD